MATLSKIFRRADPLEPQAQRLVPACLVLSTSSFVPLLDNHPFLNECKVDQWDFFATAAAVFIGINNLKRHVSRRRFKSLYSVMLGGISQWNPQGEEATLDCQKFVARIIDSKAPEQVSGDNSDATDAVGMWVLWNVLQRKPSYEEAPAAREIGLILASSLQDWWDAKG